MNQPLEFASDLALAPDPAPASGLESGALAGGPAAPASAATAGPNGGSDGDSGPAALADLVAAGLVSHEMIGDPARLRGETATLRALCRHVPGSIWRIEPYHYAFRLAGSADAEAAATALEAALVAELGADAVWVSATDLLSVDLAAAGNGVGDGAAAGEDGIDLDAPLLLLRAGAAAVAEGLAYAGPEVQAIVSASFAAQAAHLAAGRLEADRADVAVVDSMVDPELALRLVALEAGQARIEVALAAEAEARAASAAAELRLTELLAKVLRRLDAQADVLHGHIAREDTVADRLGEIAALAGTAGTASSSSAAFQETLGLALAEFLARLERREAAPARVPQVS